MGGQSHSFRKVRCGFVFALLVCAACGPHGDRKVSDLFERIECLEDVSATFSERQVVNHADWRACSGDRVDRGFTNSALWLRLSGARQVRTAIIAFEWKVLGSLDLFVLEEGRVARHAVAGINRERSRWPLAHGDYPAFPVTTTPDRTYLFRLTSPSVQRFAVRLHTPESFQAQFNRESMLIAAIAGLILFLALIYIFLWLGLRDDVYLLNALGMVFAALSHHMLFGNAFRILLYDAPGWPGRLIITFGALFLFTTTWFFRRVVRLERNRPRLDRFFLIVQCLQALYVPLTLIDLSRDLLTTLSYLSFLATVPPWIVIMIALIWRGGRGELVPFVIGWIGYSLAVTVFVLFILSVLPMEFFWPPLVMIFLPTEMVLFAYGLYLRYRAMEREKTIALDRLERFNNPERYATSKLANLDVDELLLRLNRILEEDHVYRDETLTLNGMAKRLDITGHQLSELLNARLNVNFRQLMVNYRLREAERMLLESPEESVVNAGLKSGFNSKSAFHDAFKKKHGMTPAEFRKQGG